MNLPIWVYDLIMTLLEYEESHSDSMTCARSSLDLVPDDVEQAARAIREYKINKEST